MYTETELRAMLRHSADRVLADTKMPTARPFAGLRETVVISPGPNRTHRRAVVRIIAVAASVVAVIAGVVALVHREQPRTVRTTPAATAPVVARPVPSNSPSAPPRVVLGVPVVDEIQINTGNDSDNYVGAVSDGSGQQVIRSQIGGDREANLVIAPAAAFNGHKIPLTRPVAIAGTTGYYAVLRLFPLAAGGDGGSDPTGTVVFRTPDQHWAFAWLQHGTDNGNQAGTPIDDPRAIVDGFDSLHATFTPGTARTPLRVGYLPANAVFDNADLATVGSDLSVASILTQSGNKQIDIALLNLNVLGSSGGGVIDNTTCTPAPQGCTIQLHRDLPGGFALTVNGTGYSVAETKKVLDDITVASDPNDASTYPLLTEAVS